MASGILHMLTTSMCSHISTLFQGDVYDQNGTQIAVGHSPDEFAPMLTYVDRNGVTRIFGPSLVKIGRFQDDPTVLSGLVAVPSCYVEVHANDPYNPGSWSHSIASPVDNTSNAGVIVPRPWEVGGTALWWYRFLIKITIYFIDSDQTIEQCSRIGNSFLAALQAVLDNAAMYLHDDWVWLMQDENGAQIVDMVGNRPLEAIVVKSEMRFRGGPDTPTSGDYIWDGNIYLQVLVENG